MERAFRRKSHGMTKFNSVERMKIKIGDCITTSTEKTVDWGKRKS